MYATARTVQGIRLHHSRLNPVRTPVSPYLDEYIAAEIQCMVRDLGGWRRCRNLRDQNRLVMKWIEKNAARFRSRWNRDQESAEIRKAAA